MLSQCGGDEVVAGRAPRCFDLGVDGAIPSLEWKQAVRGRFVTSGGMRLLAASAYAVRAATARQGCMELATSNGANARCSAVTSAVSQSVNARMAVKRPVS